MDPTALELTVAEEKFCQEIVSGKTDAEAFTIAFGYGPAKTGFGNADRVKKKPQVQLRLMALRAELAERYERTREAVIDELSEIAFHNPADYLTYDEDGQLDLIPMRQLKRRRTRAIKAITKNADGSIKLEFHDKNTALDRLAKILQLYNDTSINAQINYVIRAPAVVSSSEEWERIAQEQFAAAQISVMPEERQLPPPAPDIQAHGSRRTPVAPTPRPGVREAARPWAP